MAFGVQKALENLKYGPQSVARTPDASVYARSLTRALSPSTLCHDFSVTIQPTVLLKMTAGLSLPLFPGSKLLPDNRSLSSPSTEGTPPDPVE